jgi:hypothetical protein
MHVNLANVALVLALSVAIAGCGDDTTSGGSEHAGSGGTGGNGGQTTSGGSSGTSSGSGSGGGGSDGGSGGSGGSSGNSGNSGNSGSGGATNAGSGGQNGDGGAAGSSSSMSFFVTSDASMTGNLGGLVGADLRCQALAEAVGAGNRTWRAYLSVEQDPANDNMPTHARDRIGQGPWYNAAGVLLAENLDSLHARTGDADLFLDENGERIPGQWTGSPGVEHDILTGTAQDGTVLAGLTCSDWTSNASNQRAQVGHSDGLGPNMSTDPAYYTSWQSSHENQSCADTAPRGGAGRIYCFAID